MKTKVVSLEQNINITLRSQEKTNPVPNHPKILAPSSTVVAKRPQYQMP